MKIRFIGQPFTSYSNLIEFIEYARDGNFKELRIAVAWAKRSGFGRVWDVLEDFKNKGGRVALMMGVSEGGATKEGLELALDIADEGYIFHDPRRTFHPKVYLASAPSGERSLFVGSSNLTAGGLGWNYEASVWIDMAPGEDQDLTDNVNSWFDSLISQTDSCSPLTLTLIEQMEASDDIIIGSEVGARRRQLRRSDVPEDNDSALATTVSGLFKSVKSGLRRLPGLSSILAGSTGPSSPSSTAGNPRENLRAGNIVNLPAASGPAPLPFDNIQRRWVKKLDHTAAQQVKSPTTNPTGNLRLSQETEPIDHKRYFRQDFFGGLPWTPTENKRTEQEVVVEFRTWIDGHDFGSQDIRLSHDPHRVAGQGNVPTVLHWGPVLGKVLQGTNYIGFWVSMERTLDGSYNLFISKAPRGVYIV